ncbi:MAG: xanthine dehydrogenase family protein subunit M [Anaerolineales bacterium]|nr:xanthine dehydrogenase family protein subunit M [Anaerolineales bacterium]
MATQRFQYYQPDTLPEALYLLEDLQENVSLLAGGTDLFVQIRNGKRQCDHVVDISRIESLKGLEIKDGKLYIGATTTHAELANSSIVQRMSPILAAACKSIGAPSIRNLGTIGGNLSNASPAADSAPPLLVLDAQLELVSKNGEREVPAREFFTGPGTTCLYRNELINSISFDLPSTKRSASLFVKMGKRNALACAIASVAVYISVDEGGIEISDVRIALGSVGPTPFRASEAEQMLNGSGIQPELIKEAANISSNQTCPITDARATADYRRRVAGILVERALKEALHKATKEKVNHE